MTLQEAIDHALKKANQLGNCECANEQLQLAEWLKELHAKYPVKINKKQLKKLK